MSCKDNCGRELDNLRSSVAPRGATSAAGESTHDIELRDFEDFSRSLGLAVSPLERDVRVNIVANADLDITATTPSAPAFSQSQRRTAVRAHLLSPTLAAGPAEHQAASSNAATRMIASELKVPSWERHTGWPSLSSAAGVQHAEPSIIKNSGRPSLSLTLDAHHAPPLSSGTHSYSRLGRQSLSLVSQSEHAERSEVISEQPRLSLTTGTQHAPPSNTDRHNDGSRAATLDVDGVQPTAIGPHTRSQTLHAAEILSAHDRHPPDTRLCDSYHNDDYVSTSWVTDAVFFLLRDFLYSVQQWGLCYTYAQQELSVHTVLYPVASDGEDCLISAVLSDYEAVCTTVFPLKQATCFCC